MGAGIRAGPQGDDAMTRLSGIQLLALGFVLWALAVWIFGTPNPTTETTARAPGAQTEEPGTGTSKPARAEAATMPSSTTLANRGSAAPPNPDPEAGGPPPRAAPERTGIETAAAPSPAGAPAIPPAGTPAAPVATGDGPRIAPAPAGGRSALGAATSPVATDSEPALRSPIPPWDSAAGGARDRTGSPGALPPAAARPPAWFEHPPSRPPPPARSGVPATGGSAGKAVEGQLDAARRAVWEGRLADALAHYRAAARLRPNHYVVWGEMGNVLWAMQRWSEAAYAFEGAATLLVQAGELRAANELASVVGSIDPDAAYRVRQLLWAAAQRQSG